MFGSLCSNITPRVGVGPVPVRCPPLSLIRHLPTEVMMSVPGCAPSPRIHGVWLSIHVKGITKTTDGEVALQGRGWPRQAGLAFRGLPDG